jgi:preprotein translocase subunit SecB
MLIPRKAGNMSDETPSEPIQAPQTNGEDTAPTIGLISQYVKDLSFENPSSPAVYQWQSAPQLDVQFNIGADGVGDGLFEVVLKIDVTSKSDEGTAFIVDLKYAGLFGVRNVPEDQLQPFFLAEAPRILFPVPRRRFPTAVAGTHRFPRSVHAASSGPSRTSRSGRIWRARRQRLNPARKEQAERLTL